MTTINMVESDSYRAEHYGIILKSNTVHHVSGRGVHNRAFAHVVEVWENRNGIDPSGKETDEVYSFQLRAKATVISANPRQQAPLGEPLEIGQIVELSIHGLVIGEFVVTARPLADPVLVRV